MEFVLHFLYVVAIKDRKAWIGFTPAEISMVGFWNLIIMWLKVSVKHALVHAPSFVSVGSSYASLPMMDRVSLSELVVNRIDDDRTNAVSSGMFDPVYSIAIGSPTFLICFDVLLHFLQGQPASSPSVPVASYLSSRRFNHVPPLGNIFLTLSH